MEQAGCFTDLSVRCIRGLRVNIGDVTTSDLGGGTPDQLGIVTSNALGSVLPSMIFFSALSIPGNQTKCFLGW
jgi:hypothetical protein